MTGLHKINWIYLIGLRLLLACYVDGDATHDSRRLYDTLMKGYNRLIRPVEHHSDTLLVKLGLRLSQLLDVDLKNQIMTTNVWLRHEWKDHGLKWDPAEYNDIQTIHVPSENIWLPDVVLYNNADGNYEVTLMTKALLHYTGLVVWEPPAIYKSSCNIDVEFFPFDQQECILNFGSWTYDGSQVDLKHFLQGSLNISDEQRIDCAIVLTDFYPSAEWDIMDVPARKTNKRIHCCENNYPHMTFNVTIRRKALFYTVNLIIPCVSISFLTGLVFYLPSDSGEKITLCISILLSLTVFFLMLAEIIPPTSLVIPLLGKYLLFTMVLVTFSVIVTVIVLNIHYRTPSTHDLPDWARTVFLEFLPRMLLMQRPEEEGHGFTLQSSVKARTTCPCGAPLINVTPGAVQLRNGFRPRPSVEITFENVYGKERARKHYRNVPQTIAEEDSEQQQTEPTSGNMFAAVRQSPALQQAIDGVRYIAKNLRETDEENRVCEDWKYIAMVVDRLFLYIFTAACIIGTFTIILRAPMLYDTREPIFIDENNFCNPMIGFNVTSYQ